MSWYPNIQLIFCIKSNLEFKFKHVTILAKIPFQHENRPYMLKYFDQIHENQGPVTIFLKLL